jgi:hypothetical protein
MKPCREAWRFEAFALRSLGASRGLDRAGGRFIPGFFSLEKAPSNQDFDRQRMRRQLTE